MAHNFIPTEELVIQTGTQTNEVNAAIEIQPVTVETNEVAKGAKKNPRSPPSCFFMSCFTVSVIPSINTPEYFNYFMIWLISFISSFEIKKLNTSPALTAPFPLILLSNLFVAFEVNWFTNRGKFS